MINGHICYKIHVIFDVIFTATSHAAGGRRSKAASFTLAIGGDLFTSMDQSWCVKIRSLVISEAICRSIFHLAVAMLEYYYN